MKILVTGASGQLGYDVVRELNKRNIENLGVSSSHFDIKDFNQAKRFIEDYKPTAVIHCAAYTAVDKAEDEYEKAYEANVKGTQNIARVCKGMDAKMVYISTDYVFDGKGTEAYETDRNTAPINAYGNTKAEGEIEVKRILDKYFIVRISWVFGINGGNFVKTMLRLGEEGGEVNVVSDQIGAPTYTVDLSRLLCDMVLTEKYGTYHATNDGDCSWAEFAEKIFEFSGVNVNVNHITTEQYPTKAKRPKNSRLSKKSLIKNGFALLPSWEEAVKRYLEEIR